jgi:serine/threonine protein kinase
MRRWGNRDIGRSHEHIRLPRTDRHSERAQRVEESGLSPHRAAVPLDPPAGDLTARAVPLAAALADRYRITRELGAGGMATVYLAEDVRHHRKVAVKLLHPELSAVLGSERFLKEIELTAGLQHPHILPLFDSGSADGQLYYVMPFVEGETLRARLERERQLPVRDAVRIAREVADALAYAHARGVIHRDVKPENILLQGGHALVADFGIALAVQQAGGQRITQTGLSLGTPQYMAPEQATGEKSVDARADVYALGVVTYEMLAGEPPFTGPTTQSVIAKVLTTEPAPLSNARRTVPPHVADAVHTAPAEFAAALGAADVREIAPPRETHADATAPRAARLAPASIGLAALGVLAIAGTSFWLGGRVLGGEPPPLTFGPSTRLTWDQGLEVQPAISPDGRAVAYAGGTSAGARIYVRQIAGGRPIRIADDSAVTEESPSWSPDGSRVLYLSRGAVFSAPAAGGASRQEVAARASRITSAAWAPDGRSIAYAAGDSLYVRAPEGEVRVVARLPEPSLCTWSPDSALIACASGNARYLVGIGAQFGNLSPNRIAVVRVRDGSVTTISDSTSINVSPVWSRDARRLYYVSNREGRGDVYAQALDGEGRPTAPALRLTTGLGAHSISLDASATHLAYAIYTPTSNIWSLPVPTGAPVTAASAVPVTAGVQVIENLNFSRDGRWLLYDSDLPGRSDIYRHALAGGEPERITSDPADDFSPDLSPDGTEIAFHSWRAGSRDLWIQPLDARPVQRITAWPGHEWTPEWSPDGRALLFISGVEQRFVWVMRRKADGSWETPVQRARAYWPAWSPDGRSIAFGSSVVGGSLLVMPAYSGAPRVVLDASKPGMPQVERPRWSDDGRTIYFKSHDPQGRASFWSIPAAGGAPRLLVRFDDPKRPSYRQQWTLGRNRMYFPIEDRQADVWVMDVTSR